MIEKDIQFQCELLLKKMKIKYHASRSSRIGGRGLKGEKGYPDLTIFFKGECVFVEMKKSMHDKQTREQKDFENWARLNDYRYFVVWDFGQFNEFLSPFFSKKV